MRLRTIGAVCATCATAVPPVVAIAAEPTAAVAPATSATPDAHQSAVAHRRHIAMDREIARHMSVARLRAELLGDHLSRAERATMRHRLRMLSRHEVRVHTRHLRHEVRVLRARLHHGGPVASAASGPLKSIAACESGGNPHAISASGTYRGKYQFSRQTWASVGGSGDPASAPESEQDRRAAILYRTQGSGQWPVCGR